MERAQRGRGNIQYKMGAKAPHVQRMKGVMVEEGCLASATITRLARNWQWGGDSSAGLG